MLPKQVNTDKDFQMMQSKWASLLDPLLKRFPQLEEDLTTANQTINSSRIVRGRIHGVDGVITLGTGFTCNRTTTGHWDIAFSTAFSEVPIITLTSEDVYTPIMFVSFTPPTASGFTARAIDLNGANNDPAYWDFIAIGNA